MRICKTFTFLSIFIVLFYNCSLPADDEDEGNPEEDNTTSELPWEGETDKFTINSKEGLRLNDPQENAGTAYVTIPMCLASTAPKICRMELMKLQYPQRLIRRTRLRKFWFRTVKSDM